MKKILTPLLLSSLVFITSDLLVSEARAQGISSLSVPDTRQAACDDFFTAVDRPADMSSTRDINKYIPDADVFQFASSSISNGVFTGVTSGIDSRLYLISPPDCGAFPVGGRWGSDYPIDTSKYTRVSIRMYTDVASAIQFSWNQSCWYHQNYLITDNVPTKVGWHTYTVDLATIPVTALAGGTGTWTSKPATSFRIDPTHVAGATIMIDWVRLEDPTTCGSSNVAVNASAPAGYTLSLFADNDGTVSNGHLRRLVKDVPPSSTSVPMPSLGLNPGEHTVTGWLTDDYATTYGDPWDFGDSNDVVLTGDLSSITYNAGVMNAVSPGGQPSIYMRTYDDGIDTSRFRYFSIRLSQSTPSTFAVYWRADSNSSFQGQILTAQDNDPDHDGVYTLDLGAISAWGATPRAKEFVIRPVTQAGTSFSIDFVQLSASGYKTSEPSPVSAQASGKLRINNAPYLNILEPSADGGVAFRVWDFRTTDQILEPANLSVSEILPYNVVDGRVGSFFHGKSSTNDPVFYLLHPFRPFPSILVDADRYYKLSWNTYVKDVPGRISLAGGSVLRVIYRDPQRQKLQDGDDIVHVVDGWTTTNWTDFSLDLKQYRIETSPTTSDPGTWSGVIDGLRIDPHEFEDAHDFYYGYAALRAPDEAGDKFALVYDGVEGDGTDDPTVKFYASASAFTAGSQIASTTLSSPSRVVMADTSGLADGKYYIYAEISDGMNSVKRFARSELKIDRSLPADTTPPALNVRLPVDGMAFDGYLPIEGYAFDERFAALEVLIDGQRLITFKPKEFDYFAATSETDREATYSGFERSLDTAAIAAGAHTVVIKAFDTQGNQTSRQFSVVKQPGAAPGFTSKPNPAANPISVPIPGSPTPPVNQTPVPPTGATLTIKGSHTKAGKFSLTVGKLPGKVACSLTVNAVDVSNGAVRKLKTVRLAKSKKARVSAVLQGSVNVKKASVPRANFEAVATCGGQRLVSPSKTIAFKTTKGAKNFKAAMSSLARTIKLRK